MVQENKGINESSIKQTKLTFLECYSTAMGMIIGAGIITSTGIAIGFTGSGVWLGFILAGLALLAVFAPSLIGGAVVPRTSANYFMASCISKKMGGFFIMVSFIPLLNIAFMAASFGQYAMSIFSFGSIKFWAIFCLTAFYLTNFLEQKSVAKIQAYMTIILVAAWISFIALGIPRVNWDVFTWEQMLPNGIGGMWETVAMLLFAMGGGLWLVDAGERIENPERNVVFGNFACVGTAMILFTIISIVAVGVLPLESMVNQPLTIVAQTIYPGKTYLFFVFGGALMALATTINARFLDAGNKLIRSAQEGWFPASFSRRTKNAVPYLFLTLAYLVSTLPILLGMDMSSLAKMAAATTGIQAIVPNVGFLYLIKQYPEEWKKSRWYMPKFVLAIFFIISTLILVTLTYRNFKALSPALWITFAVYFIFSYIYVSIREKHVVELEK